MAGPAFKSTDQTFTKFLRSLALPSLDGLVSEFLLGNTAADSLVNRANPSLISSGLIAAPTLATAGSGQTPGTYNWTTTGGGGSGATGTYTVNGSGIISAATLTTAGANYTTNPTIVLDVASGGTPGTLAPQLGVPTLIGSPTVAANYMQVANSATAALQAGISTGLPAIEQDQWWILILKVVSGGASTIFGVPVSTFNGIYLTPPGASFANNGSATSPTAPVVTLPATTDFVCVMGWGSVGGAGSAQVGVGGALGTVVTGSGTGGARSATQIVRIGANPAASAVVQIAHAIRYNRLPASQAERDSFYANLRYYHANRLNALPIN